MTERDTVVSLCDLTGHMTEPWAAAGYRVVLVDPQHGFTTTDGPVTRLAQTVGESLPYLSELVAAGRVRIVFAWPPCTDMASSGAPHFARKAADDPLYLAKAVAVAEQCRTFAAVSGAPYLVENPVGRLSAVFGPASHIFDPYEFTALEPADNYRKRTCLWTGNGFRMPHRQRDTTLGPPDDRIHKMSPGPDRANKRSMTPRGFARAVFAANS